MPPERELEVNHVTSKEKTMDNNGGYGFVSGLFLGATLGAMATLLLAPKSGREVRADLYAGGERLKRRASSKANDLIGKGQAAVDTAREAARDTADGVKRGAARLLRKAEEGAGEGSPLASASMSE
jgi:gas vesicle protein